jgi:hypothetical protein
MSDNKTTTPDPLDDAVDLNDLDFDKNLNPDSLLIDELSEESALEVDLDSPELDDDVLANASDMGIGSDDEEVVRELDIAGDIELAEKSRRGID